MKHQQSSIALLLSFLVAVSIYSQGCTRKSTPPVQKADVEMIGADSLEPVTPATGSSSLPVTSSEEIAELPEEEGTYSISREAPSQSASSQPRASESSTSRSSRSASASGSSSTGALSRQAARSVGDDLIKEQEDFFFKRATETRGHYESPDGELMIPAGTLAKMQGMIEGPYPVELKITCDAFNFTMPQGTGDRLVSSVVEIMGEKLQAKIFESESETRPAAEAKLTYHYKVNGGEKSPENTSLTVNRSIRYRLSGSGAWARVSVEEAILSEEKAKPRTKATTAAPKKTTTRTKSKAKAKTTTRKSAPPKTEVEGAELGGASIVPRGDVISSSSTDSPKPSGGTIPKVEESPAVKGTAVPAQPTTPPPPPPPPPSPTAVPAPPPTAPPAPKSAPPSEPAPSTDFDFDESLIPDVPTEN